MDIRSVDFPSKWWASVAKALLWVVVALGSVGCRTSSTAAAQRRQESGSESQARVARDQPRRGTSKRESSVRREGEDPDRLEVSQIPHAPSHRKHAGIEQPRSQRVACSELGFVRLLPTGFEGFRYHDFASTFRRNKGTFTHIVSQAGHGYLLVGPNESLLYYQPNTRIERLARLPALGAFQLWSDVRRREWVWVHYLRDDAVHRFELPADSFEHGVLAAGELPTLRKGTLLESVELPQFDGKSVARVFAGGWIHTRTTSEQEGGEVLLVSSFGKAGIAQARESSVTLSEAGGRTTGVIELEGYPFSMTESEGRLALVTHRTSGAERVWQVEVVTSSAKVRRVLLPRETALPSSPDDDAFATEIANRSLCLVPGRPWVVVGGKTGTRVIAYDTGTTLLTLGK